MNKMTTALAAAVILGVGLVSWRLLQPTDVLIGHSMTPPDTSAIATGDGIVEVALPAELSGNAQIGKTIFDAKCATCHGSNAAGQNGVAPPLVHKIYEPSHHSDEAFILAAQNGVRSHHWRFGDMPPVEGVTVGDVKMVAAYVRELQRANGIN